MSFKGKKNVYKCNAGHLTVTVDLDEGTTPFAIACPKCAKPPVLGSGSQDGFAYSSFYRCDQSLLPEYEWCKPTEDEAKKLRVNFGVLVKRKIENYRR